MELLLEAIKKTYPDATKERFSNGVDIIFFGQLDEVIFERNGIYTYVNSWGGEAIPFLNTGRVLNFIENGKRPLMRAKDKTGLKAIDKENCYG